MNLDYMKTSFTRFLRLSLLLIAASFCMQSLLAQTGVLDPNDPIVVYNPNNPPATPPANTLAKWVKTNRLGWNTSSLKCYYLNGVPFRIKFPKSYTSAADGKLYPLYVFFHGIGEKGTIYDNEYSMAHGGNVHSAAVDNGTFDGFLVYPQSTSASGGWSNPQLSVVYSLIVNYMIPQVKVDPNRIIANGLSGGGAGTWTFLQNYPKLVATAIPMSAATTTQETTVAQLVYNKIWLTTGGKDVAPSPYTSGKVADAAAAAGCNFVWKLYTTLAHNVWDSTWKEPTYFPTLNQAHKANPWVRYGRTEFCPEDAINVTIGVTPGFDGYEWRKDGVTIPGANSNTINVTQLGTYDCRILRGTTWSVWSPIPAVIKTKLPTVTPDIQVSGLASNVLPAPDGSTSVTLQVPPGYVTYVWQKLNPTTTLSNTGFQLSGATPGDYQVKVTEQYGCSSSFSNTFTVINANGPNPPSMPTNLQATALSQTQIKLNWNEDAAPANPETQFEIYQAAASDGPYKLIGFSPANVDSFLVTGLNAKTRYYFKIRAINNTAGSPVTLPSSAATPSDITPPTAPNNLHAGATSATSVELLWDDATDDAGVIAYDIYINGNLSYTTDQDDYTVYNLTNGQTYTFTVKARDLAGNVSKPSNQLVTAAAFNGLNYKYYTFTGTWNSLPDFKGLVPDGTGNVPNVTIANRDQEDNFAFLWEGFIRVPVNGSYTFRTNSDDGSRLWLGSLNGSTSPYNFSTPSLVNNDGLHGGQNKDGTITLTAGIYPIAIAYYEQSGGQSITVSWKTPQTGSSFVTIPDSVFKQKVTIPGSAPNRPSNLTATAASAKKINLTWQDNGTNETGYEIYRATTQGGPFAIVGTVGAGVTSYGDSSCSPATTYYYQVKAIGQYGSSASFPATYATDAQANWRFNGDYTDASGNGKVVTASGSPAFSNDEKEGSQSLSFNGSSQRLDITTAAGDFLRGGYSAKSVSFWMKSNNNTGGRIIADLGGSDNGIALRLDNNQLYAGVASNNSRKNFSVAYTSTDWNFITLVYNTNSLVLYINGTQVASNTNLGFNSVGTTTNASRIGNLNGSNAFNTGNGFFSGLLDNFAIFGKALTPADITALMNDTYMLAYATTQALPNLPGDPTGLGGTAQGPNKVGLSWTSNGAAVINGFELWRSPANNANYEMVTTIPGNTTTYTDSGLTASSTYYYKLRAVNEAGYSNYSNEINVTTAANPASVVTLNDIPAQNLYNDTTVVITLNGTTDLGSSITYSATGLPSFAKLTTNPDNTGTITLKPGALDLGRFTVTVTATDNYQNSASKVFALNVGGRNQSTISVNFNYGFAQGLPWNNTNVVAGSTSGLVLPNLRDMNSVNTGISLTLVNGWTYSNSNGAVTGNNSGVFPDNVLKTCYINYTSTPTQLRFSGLAPNKKYSVVFFAGYTWTPAQQAASGSVVGNYTIGAQTVTLDAANNTSKTVQINSISPDASGNILVSIVRAPGSSYAILNAAQLLSYDVVDTLNAPYNLSGSGISSSKIRLNWQATSDIRTGFEVWRSSSSSGTYSLLGTVAGNVTTYTDSNLVANTTFFYKVRALNTNTGKISPFSDYAGATTVNYVVNLQFNGSINDAEKSGTWNSTNFLVYEGFTMDNLTNTLGVGTGIGFVGGHPFNNVSTTLGVTTGNNSGPVPDVVMKTTYFVGFTITASFTFTGLNRTNMYNLVFYGGDTYNNTGTTVYQVGSQATTLNTLNNTTQTATLYSVRPDSSGSITVQVYSTQGYGWINSCTLQAMTAPEFADGGAGGGGGNSTGTTTRAVALEAVNAESAADKLTGFPNPFVDDVNLRFGLKQNVSKFTVTVFDLGGKAIYRKEFFNAPAGTWQQRLGLNGKSLNVGTYFIQVTGIPGEKPKTFKLVKVK